MSDFLTVGFPLGMSVSLLAEKAHGEKIAHRGYQVMTIQYLIPAYLRPHAGGRSELSLDVQGSTLADALAALWRAHLGLRDRVVDERGNIRQHINIFVNNDNSRDIGGFSAPIAEGNEIMIVPNISGG